MNRTKTRKWVEAKKVDYGGDDWGADDDLEDDDDGEGGSPPADRYHAQPPAPALRPGKLTAGLRAVGEGSNPSTPRSGSAGSARSMRPSERIALERQASGDKQRSVTGPPALHIQTGVQSQRPVQPADQAVPQLPAQPQFPPRKSSMTSQERPDLTLGHPARTSSRPESPAAESGVHSPPSAGPSSAKVVRPSEIYKRMEEERSKERSSVDSGGRSSLDGAGAGASSDTDGLEGGVKSPSRRSGDGGRALQPLATVDERKSEYGFDGLVVDPNAVPASDVKEATGPSHGAAHLAEANTQEPQKTSQSMLPTPRGPQTSSVSELRKRFSTSPQLPDLTRMSTFGSDFFSSGGGLLGESSLQQESPAEATPEPALQAGSAGVTSPAAAAQTVHGEEQKPPVPAPDQPTERYSTEQIPEPSQPKPFRPAIPGGWVSETASTPGEMATPGGEQARYGLGIQSSSISPIGEHSEDLSLKPAPLRTPTPRDRSPKKFDDDRSSNKSLQASPHAPPPLRTTPSRLSQGPIQAHDDSTDSSEHGAEEPDAQSSSIAPAPLHPARGSASDLSTEELRRPITRVDTVSTTDNASPLKESDYLRDEIIRSLSPVRKSGSNLDTPTDEGAVRESAYLSDVYGDYWQDDGTNVSRPEDKDAYEPQPLSAVKEEPGSGAASATPSSPKRTAIPATEPEPAETNIRRERFSWEAADRDASAAPSPKKHPLPELPKEDVASPSSAAAHTSPHDTDQFSPLLPLPVLNYGPDDIAAMPRDEPRSRVVSGASTIPPSQALDSPHNDGLLNTSNRASVLLSPTDEKILDLQSPASPSSPQPQQESPDSPVATPTDIPLPRSPSPTGQDKSPPANMPQVMNLKQIMALPTSPERVYKMLEARAEFAAMQSGLDQWLTQATAQPEHANAGPTFKYAPAGDDVPLFANTQRYNRRSSLLGGGGGGGGGGVGGDGADGDGAGGVGRQHSGMGGGGGSVRIAGASAQLGNLMHGQAGVKGKELLQSAGKMGKGLLSKGKSKLRERAESKKG